MGILLGFLLLLVHWIGCLHYLIIQNTIWIPPMYDGVDINFYKLGLGQQYAISFYYAILLIVGNEIIPATTLQTAYASIIVIFGAIINAFIFGNMAALMAAMNKKDSEFQETFDRI